MDKIGKNEKELKNADAAAKIKETSEKQVSELKALAEDYKDTLQRLQAEFENSGKRMDREKEEFRKFVHGNILAEFLPLVDSLNEGVKQAEVKGNKEMKHGFGNVLKQLMHVLERNGVEQIEPVGKKFDHNLHEVLVVVNEKEKEDGVVLEELQRGYTLNGKVLRPAKVKVNKRE